MSNQYQLTAISKLQLKIEALEKQIRTGPGNAVEYIDEDRQRWGWSESNCQYEKLATDEGAFILLRDRLDRANEKLAVMEADCVMHESMIENQAETIRETRSPNIRLLAAIFYLYCMKNREGWEEGPAAEECWSRVCDEVANTLGGYTETDVTAAGRWLAEHDEMIRRAEPWRIPSHD